MRADDADTSGSQFASDRVIGESTVIVGRFASRSPVLRSIRLSTGPYPWRVTLLVVLAVVAGVLDAFVLYSVARLALLLADSSATSVSVGLAGIGPYELQFGELVLLTAATLVLVAAINVPIARTTGSLCRLTLLRARRRLLSAYLRSSWGHRSTHYEGRLQEYTMSYGTKNEAVILQLSTIIVMVWSIVAIGIGAFVLAGWIAVLGLLGLGAIALLLRPMTRRIKARSTVQAKLNREYASTVAQTARISPEVSVFAVADAVSDAETEAAKPTGDAVAQLRYLSKLIPTLFQYGALGLVLGLVYVFHEFELGDLTVMGPLVVLLLRALGNTKQLQTAAQTILQTYPYVDELENEIAELNRYPMAHGTVELSELGVIRWADVSFSYVEDQPVLSGVNLEIRPGDAVGVIGPSGGGKSTFSQLLVGLRSPSSGHIYVGDVDLDDVTVQSWSRRMALVPQDNSLIRGTVAENVRFFRAGFSDNEVVAAVKAAHLHGDVVDQFPDGYETVIGPGQRELSGGQRQRLGIARALLGRPDLLVLDEPTSALDQRSEELIKQTLEELKGATTLIVIAHRPATLQVCDRVLRIADGAVTEIDPRQALVAASADFAGGTFVPSGVDL